MAQLSSRERMLAVLRYEEPDYVPLVFNSFGIEPPEHLRWSDDIEEARTWLSLGVDAWLTTGMPLVTHPDVRIREWEETPDGERYPIIVKEYDTPAGPMRQEVYRTNDWSGEDWPGHTAASTIRLFDDFNGPRYRRSPIVEEADVERLRYLMQPLDGSALDSFRHRIDTLAETARDLGVLVVAQASIGTDGVIQLCGANQTLLMALEQPELFESLLDVIHAWDRRNVEVLLDLPVDLIMRRGYYEGTSFWSPELFRRHFAPRIRQLTEMAHHADRFTGYTMSVGLMPLLDDVADIGYDVHYLLDPIPNNVPIDLHRVKSALDGKVAVIGGLNAPITLEQGSPADIRGEVHAAVRALGPGGGLGLTAAEAIFATTPWQSIERVISAWKEVRDYPIVA